MSKIYDMTVIAISPSDNTKIDPIQTPNLCIIKLPKAEKIEISAISRKIMNPLDRRQEIILERVVDWYYNYLYTKL
jgi:hypothetical protein